MTTGRQSSGMPRKRERPRAGPGTAAQVWISELRTGALRIDICWACECHRQAWRQTRREGPVTDTAMGRGGRAAAREPGEVPGRADIDTGRNR